MRDPMNAKGNNANIPGLVREIAEQAKTASRELATLSTDIKNRVLLAIADSFDEQKKKIQKENAKDIIAAKEKGLSVAMVDRLRLTDERISGMSNGLREVAALPDPVGEVTSMRRRPNDLLIGKVRVPLGVIGIIYESRPNVTADAAALCIKSGNSIILRGGSEAIHSNTVIAGILNEVGEKAGLPKGCIGFIPITDRLAVDVMLGLKEQISAIIPRGGKSLIRAVAEKSRIPVIKHYDGVCHVYVDKDADLDMAEAITMNGKVQRPSVCNAVETLLVHQEIAPKFLPLIEGSFQKAGVEIRGCELTKKHIKNCKPAVEEDWSTEYLNLTISIRVTADFETAVTHINKYGSAHTDTIVTNDYHAAQRFLREVDSAAVMVNASTRFHDGGEFGLGAEMGISTDRLHARGPVGLSELTIEKYIVYGNGQIRE
jgi:glutamate-5-semialdehyde dehydrogenase